MSKLAERDFTYQQYCEILDQVVLKKIRASILWSMNTWGGSRCGGCGLKVSPRCQADMGGHIEDEDGQRIGVFHGYGNACDSPYFFGQCPGENLNWMEEASVSEEE